MPSIADEIDRLVAQRAAGHLTEAEFESAKARALGGGPATFAPVVPVVPVVPPALKLRRPLNDRWIGGVCGGIAQATGVESWIVRMLFAVALVFGGFGLIPYLLLWIFVPPEGT